MENILKDKVNLRKIYKGSRPNYSTLIFRVENEKKKKIIKYLNNVESELKIYRCY